MNSFKNDIKAAIPDLEFSKVPATIETISAVEKYLGISMGCLLQSYLLNFGYIAFGHVELLGVNERQKLDSDMVRITKLVSTLLVNEKRRFVVIEDQGDGDYILCDDNDNMFEFIPTAGGKIRQLNQNLADYIIARYRNLTNNS